MRLGLGGIFAAGLMSFAGALAAEPVTVVNSDVTAGDVKTAATTVAALPADATSETTSGGPAQAASQSEPVATTKPKETPKTAALTPVKAKPRRPSPTVHAMIDLSSQRMTVKVNGEHLHTWKISSGRAGYHTPRGSFRPTWLSRMHYSRQYDGAPMPYSVFFNRGIATHGTNAVSRLGRPASHGCIRLRTPNARTFYNLVRKHGKSRVRIVVKGTTPRSSVPVARRNRQDRSGSRVARRETVRPSRREARRVQGVDYAGRPWWYEAARSQRNASRAAVSRNRVRRIRQAERRVYRRQTYRQMFVRRPSAARRPIFGRPRGRRVFPGDR